jgi:deazaflavin-dependent oxidoreductase (nitroreductase family)
LSGSDRDPATLPFCYLTTIGRRTGDPHRIEIWFALHAGFVYMLSGGGQRSDWVRNIEASPEVTIEIGGRSVSSRARIVDVGTDEDALARRLLLDKYQPGYGEDLSDWGRTALVVAIGPI